LALGFAALVAIVALLIPGGDYGTVGALGVAGAILSLILIWPMVSLLRQPEMPMTQTMVEPAKAPDVTAATSTPAKPAKKSPAKK
jgi:hypothetical protein